MKYRTIFLRLSALVFATLLVACEQSDSKTGDNWPTRPVNVIVYSSAGGGTDLVSRAISAGMKDSLGVEMPTSNMPGALGGAAVSYVWNQAHDGYRLIGLSEGALAHSVLGLHNTTAKDWEYFIVGGTLGVISVKEDSPFQTFDELYAAVKAEPGSLKIATSIPGGVWQVQWLNTKKHGGFDLHYVPYPGSFPSQTAALSGEVDVVWTGLGEQSELLKGDKLRPLAVFDAKPLDFEGQTIPPITDFIPEVESVMPINQFVGLAVPVDTPAAMLEKFTAAFEQGMQSEAVKTISETRYFNLYGWSGAEAKEAAYKVESTLAWTLWDEGVAQINPADLNIERSADD